MGFIPEFCLIKILCLVGIWRVRDEEAMGYVEMNAESKKAMHFIELIKQYKELALRTRDASKFLGRRAVTMWENSEEDLSEQSEQRGDGLYQLVNVALPPSGAARSQVDQGRRRGYHQNEITKLPQCNV